MKKIVGFTLIELLISMALLSMIVLVGASAFGLFSQRWDGQLGDFNADVVNTRNRMLVQEVLDHLVPYVALDTKGRPVMYFEGNRNGFVAVSSRSLFSSDTVAVVRFSVRQNTDLTYDVIYEEWPMRSDVLRSTQQKLLFSPPLVLFKSVSDPVYEYFALSAERQAILNGDDLDGRVTARWVSEHNGVQTGDIPLKARLRFGAAKGPYEIVASLSQRKAGLLTLYRGRVARDPLSPPDESEIF